MVFFVCIVFFVFCINLKNLWKLHHQKFRFNAKNFIHMKNKTVALNLAYDGRQQHNKRLNYHRCLSFGFGIFLFFYEFLNCVVLHILNSVVFSNNLFCLQVFFLYLLQQMNDIQNKYPSQRYCSDNVRFFFVVIVKHKTRKQEKSKQN